MLARTSANANGRVCVFLPDKVALTLSNLISYEFRYRIRYESIFSCQSSVRIIHIGYFGPPLVLRSFTQSRIPRHAYFAPQKVELQRPTRERWSKEYIRPPTQGQAPPWLQFLGLSCPGLLNLSSLLQILPLPRYKLGIRDDWRTTIFAQ